MNNREIKFRVWNTKRNSFLQPYGADGNLGYPDLNVWYSLAKILHGKYKFLIPSQFSGLKDENDREIYEGDIVENSFYGDENRFQEVVFKDGAFYLKSEYLSFAGWYPKYLKIIGNIFENKDLIK